MLEKIELKYETFRQKDADMKKEYTAVIKNEDNWWFGWIVEVPGVNCQERTREKLMDSLHITLKEALEFNKSVPF